MDNEIFRIVLSDGTEIENLTMNGNNYISKTPIDKSVFSGNLSPVKIYAEREEEAHESMALIHLTRYGSEFWFALRDLTEPELREIKNRSDIEYIAMMTDVEL